MLDLSDSYIDINSSFNIKRNKKKVSKFRSCINGITFSWAKEVFRNPALDIRDFHQKVEEKSVIDTNLDEKIEQFDEVLKST
jgi:hypothetical protein